MEYKEYLRSTHWQEIRERVHAKHNECQNCGTKRGLDIHHNQGYANIGHEKLSELRLLCRNCHYRTHRMKGGIFHWHPDDVIMRVYCWLKKNYAIERRRAY